MSSLNHSQAKKNPLPKIPKKRKFIPNATSWDDEAFQSSVKELAEFEATQGHLPFKMVPKDNKGVQEGTVYCQEALGTVSLATLQVDVDGGVPQPPGIATDTNWLFAVKDCVASMPAVPPIAPQNEGDPTQSPAIVPASGNSTRLMNKHIHSKERGTSYCYFA